MRWCPKCKTKFEKRVKVCSTCNVELVAGSSFVLLTSLDQRE